MATTFSISGISNKNLSSILNTNGTITVKPKITVSDTTTPYYVHLWLVTNNSVLELMRSSEIKGTKTVTMTTTSNMNTILYNLGTNINYSSFVLRVTVSSPTPNTIAIATKNITITNDLSVPTMSSYSNTTARDNNMYSFNIVSEFRYGSVFSSSTATLTSSDGTKYTANGNLQSDGKTIVYLFTAQTWSSHFTDKKYDVVVTVKNTKKQTGTFNVPFPFHYLPNVNNWTLRRLNGIEDIVIFRGTLEMSKYRTDGIAVDRFTLAFQVNGGDNVWHSQPENFDVSLFGEQNAYNRVTCNVEFAARGDPNIDNKWATDKDYLVAISCSARSGSVVISTAYKIPKGIPTMAFRTDGTVGVAFGGYYDENVGGLVQFIGGKVYVNGVAVKRYATYEGTSDEIVVKANNYKEGTFTITAPSSAVGVLNCIGNYEINNAISNGYRTWCFPYKLKTSTSGTEVTIAYGLRNTNAGNDAHIKITARIIYYYDM